MKKFVFPLLIITIVLIAGCVQDGGGVLTSAAGTGLEITDFTVEPSEVRGNGKASFVITAENQGDFKVTQDKAVFTLILPSDWNPFKDNKALNKDMSPADPSIDRAADIVSKRFSSTAPSLSRGQTRDSQITIRSYYDYQTDANGDVYLYPFGEEREDVSSFQSDNAPIKLDVRTSPTAPVIEDENDYFTLIIDITNIGSGSVYLPDMTESSETPTITSDDYNKVKLSVDIKGVTGEHDVSSDQYYFLDPECQGIKNDDGIYESEVELYGKTTQKATIMCDVEVKSPPTTKTPLSIVVAARYGYYTEVSDSITIIGRD